MRLTCPLILTLILSSCSTYKVQGPSQIPSTERGPSSFNEEVNFNKNFEAMMDSQDPEKEFLDYLTRTKSLYVRAEVNLADFDHELDEAVASNNSVVFENSKNYKKLIVMWNLGHRLEDKIIFNYLKLSDVSHDKSLPVEKRAMAKDILFKFKGKLESKDPMEQIAFDGLKSKIASAMRERRGIANKTSSKDQGYASTIHSIAQIEQDAAELPVKSFVDDHEKLSAVRHYREKMREMGKVEQESNDELTQKIDSDTEKLQMVDASGREPQSVLKLYPSTTSSGNILGLSFPKNVWALTYDDGPNPIYTPQILKNLEELGIKATFFWLAENVVRYKSIVDMVGEQGMARENHSWSHPQLPKLSAEKLQKEIVQSTEVDAKAYGEKPRFFRCPYGAGNAVPRIRQMIANQGMIHVFWNVDTLDWQDKDPDSIVARAQKQMKANGRGVVLFHDVHPQSVVASKKLVEWSKNLKGTENEIRWVTLPEIVDELNGAKK